MPSSEKDIARVYLTETDEEVYPVAASTVIAAGAMVVAGNNGYAKNPEDFYTITDAFLGFCLKRVDNSSGLDGEETVRVKRKGRIKLEVEGGVSVASNKKRRVYAIPDGIFTVNPGIYDGIFFGYVSRFVSEKYCIVSFDADLAALGM